MHPPVTLKKLPVEQVSRLNNSIAIRANQIFATMGFFWFCLIFSLIPLRWPATMPFVQYASSGVLQLIALPLLGVGTLLAARASDQIGKEQHDAVMETVRNMQALMTELHEMHRELTERVGRVLEEVDDQES
ncbi:MAG: hypothetical protein B7Z80_06690 [Rhodospirillales bacterium 20-64-7]|nr:MAG: hypothetical protein B7Z80_06690 [Rhodospirillales bacterium 20-64-7]